MSPPAPPDADRKLWPLLWAQSLGVFNDNAFKTMAALLAVSSLPPEQAGRWIAAVGAVFMVPFILASTVAGSLADRVSKKRLIVVLKWVELGLMLLGLPFLQAGHLQGLIAVVFLLGVHSAFLGPAKLAILPEILSEQDLSRGNGLMQMTGFAGILLGTMAAGVSLEALQGRLGLAGLGLVAAAAAGLLAARAIPDTPALRPEEPLRLNVAAQAWENWLLLRRRPLVYMAVLGSAWFWFVGALLQMDLLLFGRTLMGLGESATAELQAALAIGIGLGSYAAGRLSRGQVELGLVPLGALGLVAFSADLSFAYRSPVRVWTDLLLLGLSGGLFVLPLQTLIQSRSPAAERGRHIATANLISFAAILLASLWLWGSHAWLALHAGQVFFVASVMTALIAAWLLARLPQPLLRLVFYALSNIAYRIQAEGRENVPKNGAALLVSNHVSFVDAFLIGAACTRRVRFLMFRSYYDLPVLNRFFRAMGCIPISDKDGPKAMLQSFENARAALQAGHVVCIFGEGEITRHGQMLRFKTGLERIVKGLAAPIVPVHLDRVWGSIFSFEGGKVLLKRPRRLPYPVTVSFGRPLPPTAMAHEVRQGVLELGSEAFRHRLAERPPLHLAFLREAKRHPLRFAIADSLGAKLSYFGALTRAWLLGRAVQLALPGRGPVALLLPPSAGGALANVGLSLRGRVPINLNYTTSREIALDCARRAGADGILASRRFLEKLGWEPPEGAVFIEDVAASIGKARAAVTSLALAVLPARLLERLLPRVPPRGTSEWGDDPLDALATIIFTSGSTGLPKGVMLTHKNIQSNIEAMAQLYQVRGEDRILGVLPFFHSFGFTGTLWFPLVTGMGVVYHPNPLDAKRIGELAAEHSATFLLGTPTFLTNYLRRVEPEKFKSLRIVIAGAEKLREEAAKAFEEKFGVAPLEGYGCTELSPVVAVNIPDFDGGPRQKGRKSGSIGQPVPGVAVRIVDPDTGRDLPAGQAGLLLVKGPNVMKGYLGDPVRTAEVIKDGYYVTGDIAAIDEDGFLTITDRLSRFSKIAGEMVPHVTIEEKLHEAAGLVDQTFVVTALPDEKRGERLVVLHKGYEDLDGLLKKLQAAGLPKLWVPDKSDFHKVESFPLLGSGKLDLSKLKAETKRLAA